jgi:FkbM family methyltransferase
MAHPADPELRRILGITRRLPRGLKSHKLARVLRKRYLRRPRPPVEVDVLGHRMVLDPHDFTQGDILFSPQSYDYHEIDYLREHLNPGDTFLDLGSNVGFYAFQASKAVGPEGKVVAVEATPATYEILRSNAERNGLRQLVPVHAGLSDKRETLKLEVRSTGQGNNTFVASGKGETVGVECYPLLEILRREGVERVDGAKIDVEGFEFRVLSPFFETADPALHPRFLIVELNLKHYRESAEKTRELLERHGYREIWNHRFNSIFVRPVA